MTALAIDTNATGLAGAFRDYWRAAIPAAAMLILAIFAGASIALDRLSPGFDNPAYSFGTNPVQDRLRAEAAAMSATQLKQMAAPDAVALNASIPIAEGPNPAARPFSLGFASDADRLRSVECLTAAIYYEAANEPLAGQRAVAQVVLNRVRHPAYPSTVCGVVFEGARRSTGCQFSFTCDGSLRRAPIPAIWGRARSVAEAALNGYVHGQVGWSTHYHANYVVPYWASSLVKAANIGLHIFYRWRGGWGRAPAFTSRYAGVEPVIRWRGGFGQPTPEERLAAGELDPRDAEAAAAAAAAVGELAPVGSVDSFQRAVLRRYEPLRRDTATAQISERAKAEPGLTASQRWALTGSDSRADTPQQRPLGRWGTPPAETPAPPPAQAAQQPPATQPQPGR